tara:strand:- start:164 stop:769 length:606 start_codon:yes stop_codon:yes gene_type:complete
MATMTLEIVATRIAELEKQMTAVLSKMEIEKPKKEKKENVSREPYIMATSKAPDRPTLGDHLPKGETLVTYASLDDTGREMIEMALVQRNKERMLAGEPKYESVEAMVDAYVVFNGKEKGLSRAQCEDVVMRFLHKKALLIEAGDEGQRQIAQTVDEVEADEVEADFTSQVRTPQFVKFFEARNRQVRQRLRALRIALEDN